MGRICPRVSQQWCGYFTSQVYPLLVLELMALKPPFFVTVLSYQGPRLPHGVASSTVFPTHGHLGVTPLISPLGDASLGWCLSWAMSLLGDVSLGQCLSWAMSLLGDVSVGQCLSWAMSLLGDVSLGRCLSWAMPLLATSYLATSYFRATSYFDDVTSDWLVDFSSLGPLRGPTMCWLWLLVNVWVRDGTKYISDLQSVLLFKCIIYFQHLYNFLYSFILNYN